MVWMGSYFLVIKFNIIEFYFEIHIQVVLYTFLKDILK